MKNVLQIMDYAAPYRGNFISSIECLEKHWLPHGNMIFLLPETAKNIPWVKNFAGNHRSVYFIARSFFSRKIKRNNIKQIKEIIHKHNIDIIHLHFVTHNYNLFLLSKLLPSIYIVTNLHNHYIVQGRLGFLKKVIFKHTVDFVIGDSESVSESAYAIGIRKDKVKTILNSIQFKRLDDYENIDLHGDYKNAILMFGYPWYRKGVDIVVKAIEYLNNHASLSIKLLIAMAGGQENTRQGIISTLGYFPEWIVLLTPREDLATYYNAANIFISAGREEGLTYSPIEAAYCNCGLICSNIPGNPLDIPHLLIYDVENDMKLAEKIIAFLKISTNEKIANKTAQRNYVKKTYDIDHWATEVIQCYANK